MKSILRRAWDEGPEGRVRMIQERLNAARDLPDDHRRILNEIAIFGRALPKSPFQTSQLIH